MLQKTLIAETVINKHLNWKGIIWSALCKQGTRQVQCQQTNAQVDVSVTIKTTKKPP